MALVTFAPAGAMTPSADFLLYSAVFSYSVSSSEDPDQTTGMRKLILAFVVCMKTCFRMEHPTHIYDHELMALPSTV